MAEDSSNIDSSTRLVSGDDEQNVACGRRRHRVLMVCDFFFPNFGGVESHIYLLAQCLLQRGHKVVVLTHAYGNRVGVRYLTNGLKVYYAPRRAVWLQATPPSPLPCLSLPLFRSIIVRERIDIVHGHQSFAPMCHDALLHACTLGRRAVFTDHSLCGFADAASIHMNKLLQFSTAAIHAAICVSHTSKENTVLRAAPSLPPHRVAVIPNAVDANNFLPDPHRCAPGAAAAAAASGASGGGGGAVGGAGAPGGGDDDAVDPPAAAAASADCEAGGKIGEGGEAGEGGVESQRNQGGGAEQGRDGEVVGGGDREGASGAGEEAVRKGGTGEDLRGRGGAEAQTTAASLSSAQGGETRVDGAGARGSEEGGGMRVTVASGVEASAGGDMEVTGRGDMAADMGRELEVTIVVISRLVYRKGADLLVDVIPAVCARFPKVRWIIGGDGAKRGRLEEMRDRHGLHHRVEMLGAVPHSQVRSVLIRGHIFLNSSLTEAFCIAILEAACCGLFVVATRVGGVPEVLPPDMMLLADPNPPDIVEAIAQAIQIVPRVNPQAMHERVSRMYSWHDVAERTERVYDRVMDMPLDDLPSRLTRYYACGVVAGKIFCLVVLLNSLVAALLAYLQPEQRIEVAPDFPLMAKPQPLPAPTGTREAHSS
ncbi:hypothetical protein CLOM_g11593 [Closterium sp. NIES-68]|nr:hypothetical protein CLOM_g11593 [Closterium sp. NIES-68]GJP70508.1 hypothetical protein CLOP_g1442 [Closterium sp. NIES-67]